MRRVRVPSQASDVDQYLDDLFIPVLDHQIADDLSDARSLAASIKGGAKKIQKEGSKDEQDIIPNGEIQKPDDFFDIMDMAT